MDTPPLRRQLTLDRPLDLRLTLAPTRIGKADPCTRLKGDEALRASRTPDGPVSLYLAVRGDQLVGSAWGPGAEWALEQLPELVGEQDRHDFAPADPLVADLVRRLPGLRMGATGRLLEALLPAVCAQGSTGFEGRRAYRQIVEKLGEPAPGPRELSLMVPPTSQRLADTDYQELHLLGLEQARADIVRRAAARAQSIETLVGQSPDLVEQGLRAVAGIGVWTAAVVRQAALGDPDVVPVGDHQTANLVAWVFTGQRRGSDAAMLELLEPFRGQRGRVLRLLKAARLAPPAHGR